MNVSGSRTLRAWFEQQEHWRQAPAVQRGEQPAADPDAWELEELGEGLRLYNVREEQRQVVEGGRAVVIQRLTKRLEDGWWQTVYEVEHIRRF